MNRATAKSLAAEVAGQVADMGQHCNAVDDYSNLLLVFHNGPDAEQAREGVHRVLQLISDHGIKAAEIAESLSARLAQIEQGEG